MHEVFPIMAGVVLTVMAYRFADPRFRLAVIAVLAVVIGFTASLISGELELSWGFVPVDIAQVLLAAGLTSLVLRRQPRLAALARTR